MTTTAATLPGDLDPTTSAGPRIEVPKPLSDDQVRDYINDGFLIVPNVLSRVQIDELFQDTVKILRGKYECDQFKPVPDSVPDEEVSRGFLSMMNAHFLSPVLHRYTADPQICGMLSQLVGAHIPFWDGSVKCLQSLVFVKSPGMPGQAWHQDELYLGTRDRSLTGVWIALDDATTENGCLYVIPGSHRTSYLYPQHDQTRPDEWDQYPESYGFDDSKRIPVEVKAGSVIFFNGYILHCSFKNRSQMNRRSMVSHYCNAWSPLLYGGHEDIRTVYPVAGIDPYAWKGYVEHKDIYCRTTAKP